MEREAEGDYSNFKGSVYHLRYALRMLLTGEADSVWFYEGNDLLARPVVPVMGSEVEGAPTKLFQIGQKVDHQDVWVQLKYTERHWTVGLLLDGNLLPNFICNAVQSIRSKRDWEVRLVTPALVGQSGVLTRFIQNPEGSPANEQKLNESVRLARENLIQQGLPPEELDPVALRAIALQALKQLDRSVPVRHETLVAEIDREIAYDYPEPRAVREISSTLLGAMLHQAGAGPENGITYDAAWLAEAAGRSIGTRSLLSTDPILACENSVSSSLPTTWDADQYVPRPRLHDSLDRFLAATEPVFVLMGASGSGKSWAIARWTQNALKGQIRLLIGGYDLNRWQSLDQVLARKLEKFAPSDWSTQDFIRRLTALRMSVPVTIVIDDLNVGPHGAEELRQTLASIVDQCQESGFKLVLTARDAVWELYNLDQELPAGSIYKLDRNYTHASLDAGRDEGVGARVRAAETLEQDPNVAGESASKVLAGPSNSRHSYVLEGYTDQELVDVLSNRLNVEQDDDLIRKITTPYFVALRTPFILDLFIDQNKGTSAESLRRGAPFAIDTLLDQRVERSLKRIAVRIDIQPQEMYSAFEAVSGELWERRSQGGMPRNILIRCLEDHLQSGIGGNILQGLMTEGLVTFNTSYRFVDPIVAERIFAARLLRGMREGTFSLEELDPESDTGTAAAILRAHENPAVVATQLFTLNKKWRRAVCSGLAQCDADDFRVLATLTSLARTDSSNLIPVDATEALGYLAARSRRAWKWLARLFLGDWSLDSVVAERALAVTANLVPTQVAALIRVQLQRAKKLSCYKAVERKERNRLLARSLTPFLDIQNQSTARVALSLLDRYGQLVRVDETSVDHRYVRDVDAVRGAAALYLGRTQIDFIIADLHSSEWLVRYRAARALKPVVLDQPSAVVESLTQAISSESEPDVLNELLWSAHRIATVEPELLMDSFEASKAADWDIASQTAGTALALLSDLAEILPDRLFHMLPRSLDTYDPEVRALHLEALAFAWWRLAETNGEARTHLADLATSNLADVPTDFHVFALRGAAIAQLGLICIDCSVLSNQLVGWHNLYSGMGRRFVFVWTDQFTEQHAAELASHRSIGALTQLLNDAIVSEAAQEFDPLRREISNSAYIAASQCLEMLIYLSASVDNPITIAEKIPSGRQRLYFVRRLLELGKVSNEIIEFAVKACEETDAKNALTTATDERENCLAVLSGLGAIAEPALSMQDEGRFLPFGGKDKAGLIAQIGARGPARFLSALHDAIEHPADLSTLYNLNQHVRRWDELLVSEVYARMYKPNLIGKMEAKDLVVMMLDAIEGMPSSPEQQEYHEVYTAIAAMQAAQSFEFPTIPQATSPLQGSHQWAMEIASIHKSADGGNPSWFAEVVCSQRGWWSSQLRMKGDTVHFGYGNGSVYMFPAVRLVLNEIGKRYEVLDPGGAWLVERMSTAKFIQRWTNVLDQTIVSADERARAYRAFQSRAEDRPRDERFWSNYGLLALFNDDLEAAERLLERAISIKWASESNTGQSLYNLACTYSRQGRSDASKEALARCLELPNSSRYRSSLASDTDFDNVRSQTWFVELMTANEG